MLIQKKSQTKNGNSRFVKTNLILAVMTYVLVLYSTFLTRSGILGDSSVHSFVSPGMLVYFFLILFVGVFTFLGLGGIAYRWKYLNEKFNDESNGLSRELALFTGAVTLLASAAIILVGTSAPIFGQSVELRFYNELNLPIAIIIGLLNGLSLLLKWKYTKGEELIKSSKTSLIAGLVLTALIVIFGGVHDVMLAVFAFATSFAFFVNLEVAVRIIKGKKTFLGAYVAHIGIALFLLGVISTAGYSVEDQVDLVKGEPRHVLGYDLTFKGYTPYTEANETKYAFNIEVAKDGKVKNVVSPIMYVASFNNSLMREPDILTMFTRDLYISPVGYNEGDVTHGNGTEVTITKGSSTTYNSAIIKFTEFDFPKDAMNAMMNGGSFQLGAKLSVSYKGNDYEVEPLMKSENGQRNFIPAEIPDANLKIEMTNLEASGKVTLSLSKLNGNNNKQETVKPKESLSVDASIKPFINLVWSGVLVMVFGFVISVVRRTKESQN